MNVPLTINIKLNIISWLNDEARPVLTVSGDITTHVGDITNFSPIVQWIADGCNRHLERLESKRDGVWENMRFVRIFCVLNSRRQGEASLQE
jgi:hypothetical protein